MWWSVLLHKKNTEVYQYQKELISLQGESKTDLARLENRYRRQNTMILGESMVFGLMLIIGIFFIYRAYKKGMETNQQQNNFLLSITHELKSPLAATKLALETLKRENITSTQKSDLIDTGIHENNRLSNLVDNLLLAAKLDQNYVYHFKPLLLSDIIKLAVGHARNKYPNTVINVKLESDEHRINGDEIALETILNNLIDNGIKYAGDDPVLSISTIYSNNHVQFSIIDNGIGIPEKERTNVFDKFYRIGNEETRTTKGTGLGLYICKSIVEAHNGSIKINSHSPKGSKITVNLPLAKNNAHV